MKSLKNLFNAGVYKKIGRPKKKKDKSYDDVIFGSEKSEEYWDTVFGIPKKKKKSIF